MTSEAKHYTPFKKKLLGPGHVGRPAKGDQVYSAPRATCSHQVRNSSRLRSNPFYNGSSASRIWLEQTQKAQKHFTDRWPRPPYDLPLLPYCFSTTEGDL